MSANRFFYTDPLAAAWMNAHHGMKFQNAFEMGFAYQNDGADIISRSLEGGPRIRVHHDSLNLLAPQRGDIIQQGESLYVFTPTLITFDGFPHYEPARIIQRNGKPFIMPESEAA
jgi:hypothetical protein